MPDAAYIEFTADPRRARHDGWTLARQRRFIDALAVTANVTAAAAAAGIDRRSVYNLRRASPSFAAAFAQALDEGLDNLVDIAVARCTEGVLEPVFWKGQQVATRRRYNDRLLIFLLRLHRPDGCARTLVEPAPFVADYPAAIAMRQDLVDRIEWIKASRDWKPGDPIPPDYPRNVTPTPPRPPPYADG